MSSYNDYDDYEDTQLETRSNASEDEIYNIPVLYSSTTINYSYINEQFWITTACFKSYERYQQLHDYTSFIRNLDNAYKYITHNLPVNRKLIAMRIKYTYKDPQGFADDVETRFRIDIEEFTRTTFYNDFKNFLLGGETWKYVKEDMDIDSDHITGKYVVYDISTVEFITEPIIRPTQVTVVNGHKRLHGKYFVKHIDIINHIDYEGNNILYLPGDCLIMICNETTQQMKDPIEVRRIIWPDRNDEQLMDKNFFSDRSYQMISQIYKVVLYIHNIETNKKIRVVYDKNKINECTNVFIYKLGSVIGIQDEELDEFDEDDNMSSEHNTVAGTNTMNKNKSNVSNKNKISYLFYDLETVQDQSSNTFRVYSFSFINNDTNEVLTIADHDVDYVERQLVLYIKDQLSSNPGTSTTYFLYAWNGSRFDHRIIMNLLKSNNFNIKNILINGGNEILSASIQYQMSPNKIMLRDPCKIFPGSLNTIASLFGLSSKEDFDHDELEQQYRNKHTWKNYFNTIKQKILNYNTHDTRLCEKITIQLKKLLETPVKINDKEVVLNFNSLVSRSMAARKIWKDSLPENLRLRIYPKRNKETGKFIEPYLPCNPYHQMTVDGNTYLLDDILKQAVVGGRTQCPYGASEFKDAVQIDARSMYPSQAISQRYPCSMAIPSNRYRFDKLGLWKIKILSQRHPRVLPLRIKNKPLDWSYSGEFTTWTTNVSIEMLDQLNYPYRVIHGFYFEEDTTEYFTSYMNHFYNSRLKHKEKNKLLHAEDDKIKLNALTGSLLQDNFKTFIKIMTEQEHIEFFKKYSRIIHTVNVEQINDDKYYVTFKPKKLLLNDIHLETLQREACMGAITENPGILTCFILEYSRSCLLKTWVAIEDQSINCHMLMCDTDSLLFTKRDYVLNKMKELKMEGSSMGEWGFDFHNVLHGYTIRPKFYALKGYKDKINNNQNNINNNNHNKIIEKVRVKGVTNYSMVSTSTDQYLFKPFPNDYTNNFDIRSDDYMKILKKISENGIITESAKKQYLGAKFKHVESVYKGEYMQVFHFQMRKSFKGIQKKYVILNLAKETYLPDELYINDMDDFYYDE